MLYIRFSALALVVSVCTLLSSIPATVWAGSRGTAPWVGETFIGVLCRGGNPSGFGPYDYTLDKGHLPVVERAHFRSETESLAGGGAGKYPAGGIGYTLVVFPNHHRALNSAIRLHFQLKLKKTPLDKGEELRSPIECYLQRAVNYSPKDATSHMLYAMLLQRSGKPEESLAQYHIARELHPGSPNVEYNYALLLVDLGEFSEAREIANELYRADFPLPGLKNKLKSVGQWE